MTDAFRYPCAQCGGSLSFSPQEQALICGHCGHRQPVDDAESPPPELDYAAALANGIASTEVEERLTIACEDCGAETSFDPDTQATACPFCAAPLVAAAGARRRFKPGGVLPFALTEREARAALARWLKGLWFAPGDVVGYARAERPLSGVYLPFWTFDADARAAYRGARGIVRYVTRSRFAFRDGKRVQIQQKTPKVRWTPVSGVVRRQFDDVLVAASRTLPPALLDRLDGLRAGWDLHDLRPYHPDFLAGFNAEAYQIDLEESFSAARAMMEVQLRRDVRFDIGGDRQRVDALDSRLNDVSFKHVLLPVWIAAYRYRGEAYRFIVNARTGEVIGERPYSAWKIAAAITAALILVAAVAYTAGASGGF